MKKEIITYLVSDQSEEIFEEKFDSTLIDVQTDYDFDRLIDIKFSTCEGNGGYIIYSALIIFQINKQEVEK